STSRRGRRGGQPPSAGGRRTCGGNAPLSVAPIILGTEGSPALLRIARSAAPASSPLSRLRGTLPREVYHALPTRGPRRPAAPPRPPLRPGRLAGPVRPR